MPDVRGGLRGVALMSDSGKHSRRSFFKGAQIAGLAATSGAISSEALAKPHQSPGKFPEVKITPKQPLKVGETLAFTYPDAASPCLLIRTKAQIPHGVGPGRDLIAFSLLCPHQGFPLAYDAKEGVLKCRAHFSKFDAELGGRMICGQATSHLARIELETDAAGQQVKAVGVVGLIQGRVTNQFT
jgi:arsenite oxidase small subunit